MTKIRKEPDISNRSKNKEPDANSQEEKNTSVHPIKKEKISEDFIPFQQTFVNVSDNDMKKEETHNVLDLSESDPLNTKYISQIYYLTTDAIEDFLHQNLKLLGFGRLIWRHLGYFEPIYQHPFWYYESLPCPLGCTLARNELLCQFFGGHR